MIFLCQNESQGIAYQQALSCGVPVFAWDPGGPWRDPDYYPHRVQFAPVSSVPYWDDRCGAKFTDMSTSRGSRRGGEVSGRKARRHAFDPRGFVLDELTLEQRALQYYEMPPKASCGACNSPATCDGPCIRMPAPVCARSQFQASAI